MSPLRRKLAVFVDQWNYWTIWPMFLASVVYVVLSTILLVVPKDIAPAHMRAVLITILVLWAVFIANLVLRMLASPRGSHFIKQNWAELVSVIVPVLRPLLVLTYIWRLPIRASRTGSDVRARFQITIASFTLYFLYLITWWVWLVEKDAPHTTMHDWGDSLWWGVATLTTVGYGDVVPVTTIGRLLGTLLMIGSLFLVGVVSASIISSFADQIRRLTKVRAEQARLSWGAGPSGGASLGELIKAVNPLDHIGAKSHGHEASNHHHLLHHSAGGHSESTSSQPVPEGITEEKSGQSESGPQSQS